MNNTLSTNEIKLLELSVLQELIDNKYIKTKKMKRGKYIDLLEVESVECGKVDHFLFIEAKEEFHDGDRIIIYNVKYCKEECNEIVIVALNKEQKIIGLISVPSHITNRFKIRRRGYRFDVFSDEDGVAGINREYFSFKKDDKTKIFGGGIIHPGQVIRDLLIQYESKSIVARRIAEMASEHFEMQMRAAYEEVISRVKSQNEPLPESFDDQRLKKQYFFVTSAVGHVSRCLVGEIGYKIDGNFSRVNFHDWVRGRKKQYRATMCDKK